MLVMRRAAKPTELATLMISEAKPASIWITSTTSSIWQFSSRDNWPSLMAAAEKGGMIASPESRVMSLSETHFLSGASQMR